MNDKNASAQVWGYTLLRLAIGMSMLIHGVVRLPKIAAFAATMAKTFAHAPLPGFSVRGFAYVTPPVELGIGILITLGLAMRLGLILGGAWMVVLIFGGTLIEKFDVVGIQLIYSLIFFHLLRHLPLNEISVDGLIARWTRARR